MLLLAQLLFSSPGVLLRLPLYMSADGLAFAIVFRCFSLDKLLYALLLFWGCRMLFSGLSYRCFRQGRGYDILVQPLKSSVCAVFLFCFVLIILYRDIRLTWLCPVLLLLVPLFRKIAGLLAGMFPCTAIAVSMQGPSSVSRLWQDLLCYDSSLPFRPAGPGSSAPLCLVCEDMPPSAGTGLCCFQALPDDPFRFFPAGVTAGCIPRTDWLSPRLKRPSEMILAAAALVLMLPFFLLIVCILLLTVGRPVFFGSSRLGRAGNQITVWKFRTMVRTSRDGKKNEDGEEEWRRLHKIRNDGRICSAFCRWLRRTSLDELPQLWNVLKGDMSLVGPRPVVPEEICRYGVFRRQLLSVRPGLTGLWQVSGRNHIPYDRRIQWDSYYIRRVSLWLDWEICLRTVREIFSAHGM